MYTGGARITEIFGEEGFLGCSNIEGCTTQSQSKYIVAGSVASVLHRSIVYRHLDVIPEEALLGEPIYQKKYQQIPRQVCHHRQHHGGTAS